MILSVHDSPQQYAVLTGKKSIKLCEQDELKVQLHRDFNWIFLLSALYLLYTKIIIPFKIPEWFCSDEIHHQITSLISFSWKCYIWPQ